MESKNRIFETIQNERGDVANIYRAFSNFPEGIQAHYDFYKNIVLAPDLPLPRSEREFLAVCTSQANQCPYCISHHGEALKNFEAPSKSESRFDLLKRLATVLTQEPWKAGSLRNAFLAGGFSDSQWEHAVMVVSYFNLANRCAHAMNVELEKDFEKSCE